MPNEAPKIPTPDQLMAVTNKHVAQSMDIINAQMTEVASTLGAPALPKLPKFAPPSLPKMGAGMPFPPLGPFGAPEKKGEETIQTETKPSPTRATIIV